MDHRERTLRESMRADGSSSSGQHRSGAPPRPDLTSRLRKPFLRRPAQCALSHRDRRPGRLPDRSVGLDQPAQVQSQAPSHLRVCRAGQLRLDPRVGGVLVGDLDHRALHAAGRRPGRGARHPDRAAPQRELSGSRPRSHADPAAMGHPAGRQRPHVAVDLRFQGWGAQWSADEPRAHQRVSGLAVDPHVGVARTRLGGRVEHGAAVGHPAACRATAHSGRAL